MRLLLVRHADAERGDVDELRRLTPRGRRQARDLGRRLANEGVEPAIVLSSPLLRARETAEALARATGAEAKPIASLSPGATAEDVRRAVAGRGETVVVVGHQPDCGRIAADLTGGEQPPFPTAGIAVIDL